MHGDNFSSLTSLAQPEIYCQRQKQKIYSNKHWTDKHHKAHMHIRSADQHSKDLTHSNSVSLSLSLHLATSVSLLLLLHNYTWLLISHSIHFSSPMLALSFFFPPLLFLSLLFLTSIANLSWTFPWWIGAILHHNTIEQSATTSSHHLHCHIQNTTTNTFTNVHTWIQRGLGLVLEENNACTESKLQTNNIIKKSGLR